MDNLRDGSQVDIRAIHPDDIDLERRFIAGLSPESRRFRFLAAISEPSEALLHRLTHLDPEKEAALIALVPDAAGQRAVGVGRISISDASRAELAVTVSEDWRHRGLATLLVNRLMDLARARGVSELFSTDSGSNVPMRGLAASMGFTHRPDPADPTQVIYSIQLTPLH